jgi:hypothetical protein
MCTYIKELPQSPMVVPMLPVLFELFATDKYDLLYEELHSCTKNCHEVCHTRAELVMLFAWTTVLCRRMEEKFKSRSYPVMCCKIVIRESIKRIWKEKMHGSGMHCYKVHEDFDCHDNQRARSYMEEAIEEKYQLQVFHGKEGSQTLKTR